MKKRLVLLSLFVFIQFIFAENLSKDGKKSYKSVEEFINLIESMEVNKREAFVESEMENIKNNFTLPEIDNDKVLFLYRDKEAKNINLMGDLTQWKALGTAMKNIKGTSIFYLNQKLETNARIKYRFRIDEIRDVLDTFNTKFEKSPFGSDSILEMGAYNSYYKETKYYEDIPHGRVVVKYIDNNTIFGSKDKERKIQIYLPPNYNQETKYKTLYFCDGSDYVNTSKIPNILDYMINKEEIEPIVAVFVDWIERDKEYIRETKKYYLEFLTHELIPMLEREYSLLNHRDGRIAIGPSNGGDFVCYVGAVASDKFKYIFNQSGSPSFGAFGNIDYGMKYVNDNLPIKVFSVVGKYEKDYNLTSATQFHNYLKNNPSIVGEKYVLYPQGHTYTMWGDSFREGILWLLYNKKI